MKSTMFLSGLLLLFLLPDWTDAIESDAIDAVDIHTLARIVDFFEQNYKRVDEDRHPRQYATAINVPKHQCQQNFNPAQNNFLTQENAENVKNAINDDTNALYQGEDLIAAGTKQLKRYNRHSESLLLNPAENSPMTALLNRRKDSCSVFYTFESPCADSCLNEEKSHSILKALENWKKHSGIKAFVFKHFWKYDQEFQAQFKKIVAHVPLYRCVNKNQCYACKGEGNTPIDAHCLPPQNNKKEL